MHEPHKFEHPPRDEDAKFWVVQCLAWKSVNHDQVHHTRKSLHHRGRLPVIDDQDDQTRHRIFKTLSKNQFHPHQKIVKKVSNITAHQVHQVAHKAD